MPSEFTYCFVAAGGSAVLGPGYAADSRNQTAVLCPKPLRVLVYNRQGGKPAGGGSDAQDGKQQRLGYIYALQRRCSSTSPAASKRVAAAPARQHTPQEGVLLVLPLQCSRRVSNQRDFPCVVPGTTPLPAPCVQPSPCCLRGALPGLFPGRGRVPPCHRSMNMGGNSSQL